MDRVKTVGKANSDRLCELLLEELLKERESLPMMLNLALNKKVIEALTPMVSAALERAIERMGAELRLEARS